MIRLEIENKEAVLRWLEQIKKGTGDARPLWQAMTPKIVQFSDNQFNSGSSANKTWKPLKPGTGYKEWKAKKGFATGVGVMTGKLKDGAGRLAKKKYKKKFLEWRLNTGLINTYTKKSLGSYAKHFDHHLDGTSKRPIYDNTEIRINSFLKTDIQSFNGGSYNNFTYAWLKKSLSPKTR